MTPKPNLPPELQAELEKATIAPPAQDMVELFAPLRGLNLNFEREKDPGRDIDSSR